MSTHRTLPAHNVSTLAWDGDTLVDMASGGIRYDLDGTAGRLRFNVSYPFNACVTSSTGQYTILYQRLGTKAVVFRDGEIVRELNRSFYHAAVYDYPICLWTNASGRTLAAHCPEEYNRLVVEDIATGERLVEYRDHEPPDFFHSRLQCSPGGGRLLSAGWIWHPLDALRIIDLPMNTAHPHQFSPDSETLIEFDEDWEVQCAAACWQSDDVVLAALHRDEDPSDDQNAGQGAKSQLVTYDVTRHQILSTVHCNHHLGTLMPVGTDRVVSFYGHPRLLEISTGQIVEEWPDILSGRQNSSIAVPGEAPPPAMAFDLENARFAVADENAIHVVDLSS